jgi:hypothetical protein
VETLPEEASELLIGQTLREIEDVEDKEDFVEETQPERIRI